MYSSYLCIVSVFVESILLENSVWAFALGHLARIHSKCLANSQGVARAWFYYKMEASLSVEKEHQKVHNKLVSASESTSRKLQENLDELALLKEQLIQGLFIHFENTIVPPV